MNYTIEIWLIDKKIIYNESTHENETIYPHIWFMNKISITLDHHEENIELVQGSQWEYY